MIKQRFLNLPECEDAELFELPCDELNSKLSESQKLVYANKVVDYYYARGFPYYHLDDSQIKKEFLKLLHFDSGSLLRDGNILEQNMMGLGLANSFHPQMWSVQCRKALTPIQVFNSRDLFIKAILKRLELSDSKLRPFNIRKSLKVFSGVQSVSNFRPTIAKFVYDFCPDDGIMVLDPCMGYGGRLLGALTSRKVVYYCGIDPATKQFEGNTNLIDKLALLDFEIPSTRLIQLPFEDFNTNERFDLVFTSPPYFDIEKYSDEPTQSYLRYPTFQQWCDKFLRVLIEKSFELLKPHGYFVINIAGDGLIDKCLLYANLLFDYKTKYDMRLSKILGSKTNKNQSHKLEPIYIYQKR